MTVDSTQIAFGSSAANDLTSREDTAINNTLLATFTAPPLAAGQTYTATVTWGDNTTSHITATAIGANTYAVVVNGKTFSTQGNYAGSISIANGSSPAIGTLTFTSHIGDIPLNVTNITATPLIARIVLATGTFTDDGDLSLSTWTATINWGDNTSSTAIIVRDPTQAGRYIIFGRPPVQPPPRTYSVKLTVTTTEAQCGDHQQHNK